MQTATLPPSVSNLVSPRTRAILTGAAQVLPHPTTKRPRGSLYVNTESFYIYRYTPDNVDGWKQGPGAFPGWRGDGHRRTMTAHRARLLLKFCSKYIPEQMLPKLHYVVNHGKAA